MYKIEFTEQELQALAGLLDAGVRAVGIRSVKEAAVILAKLEAAKIIPDQNETQHPQP
jgi:ABC-type Na+ efflux pump permease subunit